jgi:threonine synthase
MTEFACRQCGRPFVSVHHYRCPDCGQAFTLRGFPRFHPDQVDRRSPGIWRYRHTFGLPPNAPSLTLGEGDTPLVGIDLSGSLLHLKLESLNPTGSWKDRLAAVLVSLLAAEGVAAVVEDSSGNAGAALAAYCARAGIPARIFVPASAAGPKRAQIERFGAQVEAVPGPRQAASDAVIEQVAAGQVYASHAWNPHGLAGIATIAYELLEQLPDPPGLVLAPAGHGSLLLGLVLGFQALEAAGQIEVLPRFIGVQAAANAPLWAAARGESFNPGPTIAGGIAVSEPVRGPELLDLHRRGVVDFVTVSEQQIRTATVVLARAGIDAEPTAATVIAAYSQLSAVQSLPGAGAHVAIISGHGLKGDLR